MAARLGVRSRYTRASVSGNWTSYKARRQDNPLDMVRGEWYAEDDHV